MKKAEEYLKDAFEEAKINHPEESWKDWNDIQIERDFVCKSINQARKDALDEAAERAEIGGNHIPIVNKESILKLKDECV